MSISTIVVSPHDFSQRAEHSAELFASQARLDIAPDRARGEDSGERGPARGGISLPPPGVSFCRQDHNP